MIGSRLQYVCNSCASSLVTQDEAGWNSDGAWWAVRSVSSNSPVIFGRGYTGEIRNRLPVFQIIQRQVYPAEMYGSRPAFVTSQMASRGRGEHRRITVNYTR